MPVSLDVMILAFLALFQNPDAPSRADVTPPQVTGPVGSKGVIGADERKLLPAFTMPGAADQAAVRAGLGATHTLSCGASASLVYRNDVIIFSNHQLLDGGKPDPDVAHCFFEVSRTEGGAVRTDRYPLLLDTLDHGEFVPEGEGDDEWNVDNQRDWAIARLARPVPDIVPYRLPDAVEPARTGDAVTTASGTTDNWPGSRDPQDRLAQACHVVPLPGTIAARFPAVVHLDCDVGGGASGGAVLRGAASGHPVYLATIIAYTGNDCRAVGLDTCFSIARQLDPDLVARIKGTTALRSTPEDAALGAAQDARMRAARDATAQAAEAVLAEPFPARDDAPGREVKALSARIGALVSDGRAADADPLLLQAFRALHDPDRSRPEWVPLLVESGDAMSRQNRTRDAFAAYSAALDVAPAALKPYLQLRRALFDPDAKARAETLRRVYLAGGERLFRSAGADAELAAFQARGVPTTPE